MPIRWRSRQPVSGWHPAPESSRRDALNGPPPKQDDGPFLDSDGDEMAGVTAEASRGARSTSIGTRVAPPAPERGLGSRPKP